ncbi:MAG: hypothetical protein AAB487_00550 [Patescibacteria group bacterium]
MKLKIVIIPLLILVIIIFSIWVLAPSYFAVKEDLVQLDEANRKVSDINNKLQKAGKLNEDLLNRSEEQKMLTEYLPESREEDKIINYFNDLVLRAGLVAFDFSVAPKKIKMIAPMVDAAGVPLPAAGITPAVEYADVNLGASGTYEKIKDFLGKLDNIKRFNKISTIRISHAAANESGNVPAGGLTMTATTGFGYLEKIKSVSNINSDALISEKFDLAVIDYIKSDKNTEISDLTLEAKGKSNPFMP